MQLSVLQENLAKGLSIVSRAVAARSTLPALECILLTTEQSRLKLSATNLEISLTCWVGAKIETEGAIALPARALVDLVHSLPPGQVEMNLEAGTQTLRIAGGRFTNRLKGSEAQYFPLIPQPDEGHTIHIKPEALRQMIEQVVFAAATEDSQPILTGVQTRFSDRTLTMAAANGFRLSVRTTPLEDSVGESFEIVIPARALNELSRILADQTDPVGIIVTPQRNQILFRLSHIDLVSQLLDGQFPPYAAVIPTSAATRAVIDSALLLKACRAASVFARESSHIARLTLAPGDEATAGHLTINATSAETGDATGDVDADVTGEPLEITFNVQYLIDVLSVIGARQITLETNTASSPGMLRPVGDDAFTHIIMPMHVGR